VLGIVSLLILGNSMAEASESFPKSFYETVVKVQSEYDEDSFERKVNPALVVTVAAVESGYGDFPNAPTAKSANNYMGRHAIANEPFVATASGVKLKKYETIEDNIRDFLRLMKVGSYYKDFRQAVNEGMPLEDQFRNLNNYSTNPKYFDLLYSSYKKRISPIEQTNKMFEGEKTLGDQMNKLKIPLM
jgi:uncharacterized FlgJ-related protein